MKKFMWVFVLALVIGVSSVAFAQMEKMAKDVTSPAVNAIAATAEVAVPANAAQAQPVDAGNKVCPVSGDAIPADSNVTYVYNGKIYHFCCAGCVAPFKQDPEKYIKALEEKEETPAEEKSETGKDDTD